MKIINFHFKHIASLLGNTLAACLLLCTLSQCSYEPEISNKAVNLIFSTDSIQFDTLFTERQSVTKRLKVINPSNKAVILKNIGLENQVNNFELIINGVYGDQFQDQLLMAKDSLLILVEANIDQNEQNNPFIITDYLKIENSDIRQYVTIEAWGQNANYLRDSVINCNQTWTSERPYVLSNNVLVPEGCTLTIEAGTKIYSGKDSFIFVEGTIKARGSLDSLIIFSNDRFDEPFTSAPGQWGGIILLEGSTNNEVAYASITNGIVGFNLTSYAADGNIDLRLNSVKVGNMSSSAILALNSDFEATNSLFYNTASGTNTHIGGGTVHYNHCTIANYFSGPREVPALYISDYAVDNNENEVVAPINASFINSIVYGRITEEISTFESQTGNLNFQFNNSLFKTTQAIYENQNSVINEDPLFIAPLNDDFRLEQGSPAISKAAPSSILIDIVGTERNGNPDIGAYEYAPVDNN